MDGTLVGTRDLDARRPRAARQPERPNPRRRGGAHRTRTIGLQRPSPAGLRRVLLVAAVVTVSAACQPAAPATPGYGCGPALSYLQTHAAPNFVFSCPHDAGGNAAETLSPRYLPDGSFKGVIYIATPCPAAYMNEASNSHGTWVLNPATGLSDWTWPVPVDPYGTC